MAVQFSILMPVYNIQKYLRQTVDSLLSQDFRNFEVVIVDDGSTDGTPQILESYGAQIRFCRQANTGAEFARNKAASLAQGEYLVMMDHDDVLLPCALSTYDRIIRTFGSPALIIGAMAYFQDGQTVPPGAPSPGRVQVLKYENFLAKDVEVGITNSRIVIRKSVFDAIGGYGNGGEPAFPSDDFNLIFKAGADGPCIVVQEPTTVVRRMHETNFVRDVGAVIGGIFGLIRFDREGRYPAGRSQRLGRYAIIGGFSAVWALNYCWRKQHRWQAVRMLLGTAPMVAVAVWRRLLRNLRTPTKPILLTEERAGTKVAPAVSISSAMKRPAEDSASGYEGTLQHSSKNRG
jgi:glycosyltransferase involved in cell wall biosynthesis